MAEVMVVMIVVESDPTYCRVVSHAEVPKSAHKVKNVKGHIYPWKISQEGATLGTNYCLLIRPVYPDPLNWALNDVLGLLLWVMFSNKYIFKPCIFQERFILGAHGHIKQSSKSRFLSPITPWGWNDKQNSLSFTLSFCLSHSDQIHLLNRNMMTSCPILKRF